MEKKNKLLYVLIGIIIGIVITLGILALKNIIKGNEPETNSPTPKEEISQKEAEELFNSLITTDHQSALYYDNLKSTDLNSSEFIIFNFRNYLLENNIDYKSIVIDQESPEPTWSDKKYELNKNILSSYINKKYSTKGDYNLPVVTEPTEENYEKGYNFEGTIEFFSLDKTWILKDIPRSGGESYIDHKLINYETNGDEVYIFSKAVSCQQDGAYKVCNDKMTNVIEEEKVLDCSQDNDGNVVKSCPLKEDISIINMAEYVLKNDDTLKTYKHTFKKVNGTYYWQSSEIKNN